MATATARKPTKLEKRAKKALLKLGLEQMNTTFSKAQIVLPSATVLEVDRPDVYTAPGGGLTIIFGRPQMTDVAQEAREKAAEQFAAPEAEEEIIDVSENPADPPASSSGAGSDAAAGDLDT